MTVDMNPLTSGFLPGLPIQICSACVSKGQSHPVQDKEVRFSVKVVIVVGQTHDFLIRANSK